MHEVFDEDELPRAEQRRDTELTLGPMMLLGFFFGLLVAGLCFGIWKIRGLRKIEAAEKLALQHKAAQAG